MQISQWVNAILIVLLCGVIAFLLLSDGGQPEEGYRVILMNPGQPGRALLSWLAPTRPDVLCGGVEWIDEAGRYRLVSGTVYVEEIVPAAAPAAAPAPTPTPPDVSEEPRGEE